jgi:hypothetical protein
MAAPTDSELLDSYKQALMSVTAGQSYTINGRTLTRAAIPEIMKVIDWLEERIATSGTSDDETGTDIVRINFR